jgi:hypothetical protein
MAGNFFGPAAAAAFPAGAAFPGRAFAVWPLASLAIMAPVSIGSTGTALTKSLRRMFNSLIRKIVKVVPKKITEKVPTGWQPGGDLAWHNPNT